MYEQHIQYITHSISKDNIGNTWNTRTESTKHNQPTNERTKKKRSVKNLVVFAVVVVAIAAVLLNQKPAQKKANYAHCCNAAYSHVDHLTAGDIINIIITIHNNNNNNNSIREFIFANVFVLSFLHCPSFSSVVDFFIRVYFFWTFVWRPLAFISCFSSFNIVSSSSLYIKLENVVLLFE